MAGHVTLHPSPAIVNGAGTAGTVVATLGTANQDIIQISIRANAANAGTIYVGGSGVTTADGWPLAAGESVDIGVNRAEAIYLIASAASQAYRWLGLT